MSDKKLDQLELHGLGGSHGHKDGCCMSDKTIKKGAHILKKIFHELEEIEEEVNEVEALEKIILGLLRSPTFGLAEIKSEIRSIVSDLESPTFGLAEIKTEIREALSLLGGLESPTFGLAEIKTEIQSIIRDLESPTFGLAEIKSEVASALGLLTNPSFGLEEIKSEIRAILSSATHAAPTCLTTGPFIKENATSENINVKITNRTASNETINVTVFSWDECKTIIATAVAVVTAACSTKLVFSANAQQVEVQICGLVPGIFAFVAGQTGLNGPLFPSNVFRFAELVPQINPDDP